MQALIITNNQITRTDSFATGGQDFCVFLAIKFWTVPKASTMTISG